MAMSQSRLAFSDCYELMDRALEDHKGIRVKFASEDDAFHFRLRIHNARQIDRRDNLDVYPEGHNLHGKSPYDVLVMRLDNREFRSNGKSGCWLKLEKLSIEGLEIESLSTAREDIDPPRPPIARLPIPAVVKVEHLPFKRRI